MSRRRLFLLSFPLLLLTSGLLILPSVHWPLYAWWRGEAMYQGRPTSWWEQEIEDYYRPWEPHEDTLWTVDTAERSRRAFVTAWPGATPAVKPQPKVTDSPPLATGDPMALPVLLQLVRSDLPKVRWLAVSGLRSLAAGNPDLIAVLVRVAHTDSARGARITATLAVLKLDPEAAAEAGLRHPMPVGVADFVERSLGGRSVWPGFGRDKMPRLLPQELAAAVAYVRSHPDRSSYLLLYELREYHPDDHARLPNHIRAAVLCDALAHHQYCTDWGVLRSSGMYESGGALVGTGPAALPYLRLLLNDRRPFYYQGRRLELSSVDECYRRCDFAYRYACLILGLEPAYDPDPVVRDQAIEELQALLRAFDVMRPLDLPGPTQPAAPQ